MVGMRFRLILVMVVLLAGCQSKPVTTAAIPCENRPTATEIFNLRGRCVELGNKLAAENKPVPDFSQYMESHYSVEVNRCYVTLATGTSLLGLQHGQKQSSNIYLYDAQTREELAQAYQRGPVAAPGGGGWILRNGVQQLTTHGEAQRFIDTKMAEESQ
jgi:hypothetical protein